MVIRPPHRCENEHEHCRNPKNDDRRDVREIIRFTEQDEDAKNDHYNRYAAQDNHHIA